MIELSSGIYVLSAQAVYATIWSLTSFAVVVTLLRLYTRAFIVKALGLDDALIFFGLIGSVAVAAIQHWHVDLIWESYNSTRSGSLDFTASIRLLDLAAFSAILGDGFALIFLPIVKCSILAFYRRISPSRKHHRLLYFVAAVMILQGVLNLLLKVFALDPPTAWMSFYSDLDFETLYDYEILHTVNSAFQVVFDVTILLLPAPIIYRTRFKKRQRIGLITIYLLSFFSLAATIARLVSIRRMFDVSMDEPSELMQQRITYAVWVTVEIMTVVICANLPTMPALLWVIRLVITKTISSRPTSSSPHPYLHNPYPYPLPFYGNTSSHAFSTNQKTSTSTDSKSSRVKDRWSWLSSLTARLHHNSKDTSAGEKLPQSRDYLVARARTTEGKDSISIAATREMEMTPGNNNISQSSSTQLSRTASSERQQNRNSIEEADIGVAVPMSPQSPSSTTTSSASSCHTDTAGLADANNVHGAFGSGSANDGGSATAADGVIYVTDEIAVERTAA